MKYQNNFLSIAFYLQLVSVSQGEYCSENGNYDQKKPTSQMFLKMTIGTNMKYLI